MIAYYGVGMHGFALVGTLANAPVSYASLPCAALPIAVTRQHVIVDGTGVELQNVVRQYRLVISEIDQITVIYSRGWHFGWRIRLHCGPRYVDTFSFGNLVGFRLFGARFAAPPADAPAPVKELYGLLAARIAGVT
jgi:hypothetical protein